MEGSYEVCPLALILRGCSRAGEKKKLREQVLCAGTTGCV